ncbi:hypothetical protein ENUP19_0084G0015 [Entamoeba nuttalli]|nr:uncharacterized protein EDI_270500 [Entamoeba dispar SAW760]EDR28600.1 hypothetical protein, conserved [Entamoeba dispar SAW760]|eukprot:EDR28600.1 hypothetical protein, conserved [Entamoeba dispar SAW760]
MTKAMILPVKFIVNLAKHKQRVSIWLFENTALRIEGTLSGFDQYINLVLTDTEEVYLKTNTRRKIGTILLKGENISVISKIEVR